eukprot:135344-Rhodomonas_salina.1
MSGRTAEGHTVWKSTLGIGIGLELVVREAGCSLESHTEDHTKRDSRIYPCMVCGRFAAATCITYHQQIANLSQG